MPEVPAFVVTDTFAAPAERAGNVQVADVAVDAPLSTQSVPPTLTVMPLYGDALAEKSPVPVNVNVPPPAVGPAADEIADNTGVSR